MNTYPVILILDFQNELRRGCNPALVDWPKPTTCLVVYARCLNNASTGYSVLCNHDKSVAGLLPDQTVELKTFGFDKEVGLSTAAKFINHDAQEGA